MASLALSLRRTTTENTNAGVYLRAGIRRAANTRPKPLDGIWCASKNRRPRFQGYRDARALELFYFDYAYGKRLFRAQSETRFSPERSKPKARGGAPAAAGIKSKTLLPPVNAAGRIFQEIITFKRIPPKIQHIPAWLGSARPGSEIASAQINTKERSAASGAAAGKQ